MKQNYIEKPLDSNEHLFVVIDRWMKKYNTSPKILLKSGEEIPSVSVKWNQFSLPKIEQAKVLNTLKDWAIKNKRIVIITAACISVFTVSSMLYDAIIFVRNNEQIKIANFFDKPNFSETSGGTFYIDNNGKVSLVNNNVNNILIEQNMVKSNLEVLGNDFLERNSLRSSLNNLINAQMGTSLRTSGILHKITIPEKQESITLDDLEGHTMELSSREGVSHQNYEAKVQVVYNSDGSKETYVPSELKQTGICRNYTGYDTYYGRWTKGTMQNVLSNQWGESNKPSSRGIATLNDRYLVAVAPTFGKVGDHIDIVLEDGQVIPAIIADSKGADKTNTYGHVLSGGVDIVEWEASGPKSEINLGSWANVPVEKIVNYGYQTVSVNKTEEEAEKNEEEQTEKLQEDMLLENEEEQNGEIKETEETLLDLTFQLEQNSEQKDETVNSINAVEPSGEQKEMALTPVNP